MAIRHSTLASTTLAAVLLSTQRCSEGRVRHVRPKQGRLPMWRES